jgi:UDP-glucose 4-epimerase
MRALVTGGAGFIGSHIVDLLVAEGHDVAVVDNLVTGKRGNLHPVARFYEVDVASEDFVGTLLKERPEVVFHQAAQMSVKVSTDDPLYDAHVNVVGFVNVLEACVAAGTRKVVFASSGATYGNPRYVPMDEDHPQQPASPYGITKMAAEHYLRYYALDRGLQFTALRYGNVYGPRQDPYGEAGVVAIFAERLLAGKTPVIHWDGEQTRDYVYVGDVARANLLAAAAGDGRCYCIATGIGTTVNEIYAMICAAARVHVTPEHAPRRAGDLRTAYFDTTRARTELDWVPAMPLRDGLERTVASFQSALSRDLAGAAGSAAGTAAGAVGGGPL